MYRANTITAGNGILTFIQTLESDMTNAGWVFASQNVASNFTANAANNTTNTQILIDVLKSPSGNNTIGNDWFVAIARDSATNTQLIMSMFAGFNAASNQAWNYYLPNSSGTTCVPAANGFNLNSTPTQLYLTSATVGAVGSVIANAGNARIMALNTANMPTTANGFNYYYSVTIDRLILCVANGVASQTNLNANGVAWYVGTYDSFMPLSIDPYPLAFANLAAAATGSGAITNIQAFGLTAPYFTASNVAPAGFAANGGIIAQYVWNNCSAINDFYLGSGANGGGSTTYLARMCVHGRDGGSYSGGVNQGLRGLFKDLVASPLVSNRGDTVFWTFNNAQVNATYIGNNGGNFNGSIVCYGPFILQI